MNRPHRGTLELAAGWMTALMSRMDPVLGSRPAVPVSPVPSRTRVLVVDDDPSNLVDACNLLGEWGITPTLAADGAEALGLACKRNFDLILMDLQMPVMDGLEATRQIRAHESRQSCARVPVLAYTSCALKEEVWRDCGVDGVLQKPCSASALRECLLRWCAPVSNADLATGALAGARLRRPGPPLRGPVGGKTGRQLT